MTWKPCISLPTMDQANQRPGLLGDIFPSHVIVHCLFPIDSCSHAEMAHEAN